MSHNKNLCEIKRVLKDLNLLQYSSIERTSKSIAVKIKGPKGVRKMFASCTPSDSRNFQNTKMNIKRVAKQAGIL